MENNYCAYFYLRQDKTPYYVGMGRKQRPFAKHAHRQDKGDFKPDNNDLILIVLKNLSQEEAFELEIKYIAEYGRKSDGGILINLTEGGQGAKHNEETKKKLSKIMRGRKNPEHSKFMCENNPKSQMVSIDGIIYKTIKEASELVAGIAGSIVALIFLRPPMLQLIAYIIGGALASYYIAPVATFSLYFNRLFLYR